MMGEERSVIELACSAAATMKGSSRSSRLEASLRASSVLYRLAGDAPLRPDGTRLACRCPCAETLTEVIKGEKFTVPPESRLCALRPVRFGGGVIVGATPASSWMPLVSP